MVEPGEAVGVLAEDVTGLPEQSALVGVGVGLRVAELLSAARPVAVVDHHFEERRDREDLDRLVGSGALCTNLVLEDAPESLLQVPVVGGDEDAGSRAAR